MALDTIRLFTMANEICPFRSCSSSRTTSVLTFSLSRFMNIARVTWSFREMVQKNCDHFANWTILRCRYCNIISRITRIHIKHNMLNKHASIRHSPCNVISYRSKNNHFTTRHHNTYIIILLSFVYCSVHQSK